MKAPALSFRQRLLIGIAASIIAVFGTGAMVATWLIQQRLIDQTAVQMESAGQSLHAVLRGLVMNAVKNYLKGISETNLAYIRHVYGRFKAGELSESQARTLAERFMLSQKIGPSGYVTAVDIGEGKIRLAVHPFLKGHDLNAFPFAHQMASQRNGYNEFMWQNPGDVEPRMKAQWMSYFEPWHWIVDAAPFRDEYPQLVDVNGLVSELSSGHAQGNGYAIIINMKGDLLSHPVLKGGNIIDSVDAHTGERIIQNLIESIGKARISGHSENLTGVIQYHVKDPGSDKVRWTMMNYRYVEELDSILGIVTDLDELYEPYESVRTILLIAMAASLAIILLFVNWMFRPVTLSTRLNRESGTRMRRRL